MDLQPPRWARRFLAWYCKPQLLEEVEGDLYELFQERVAAEGLRAARQKYAWDVVRYLRPHILRRQPAPFATPLYPDMLRSYFVISLRNLWRNRLYTALNVTGLAIGISACLVIYLIVHFELSFDAFHPDRERIYRAYTQFEGTFTGTNSGVCGPLPFTLRGEVTGIEAVAAINTLSGTDVEVPAARKELQVYKDQRDIILAEPEYFAVFSRYEWLAGSPKHSLTAPFLVVLTESKAKKYFGVRHARAALGRTLRYRDSLTVTVSGIVKDLPQPTDLYFKDFISFSTIRHSGLKNEVTLEAWDNTNSAYQTFVKLQPGVSAGRIEAQLLALTSKHFSPQQVKDWRTSYLLQPLRDLHFNPKLGIFDGSRSAAHRPTLRILTGVSGLLLLIAAINFINLVTAQAVRRAREVGVRKVLGSSRRELVTQFLNETLLVTAAAVLLSVLLADLSLRYFKEFIPEGVALDLTDLATMLFLLLTTGVVSLLAGLYPAFVLSSFRPVTALKNTVYAAGKSRDALLRKGLIVFQFSFAQVLIVGTFIIGSQLSFMRGREMGFNRDAVVYFYAPFSPGPGQDHRAVLKEELSRLPGVAALSLHGLPPATNGVSSTLIEYDNGKEIRKHEVHRKYGDTAYIHLYNIPLLAGRNLLPSDTAREYLINETYARQLGFTRPGEALGKMLNKKFPIVGVVKDFHVQSLHNPVPPVVIACETRDFYCFSLKLASQGEGGGHFAARMEEVKDVWNRFYPDHPFTYTFLDESIARFYEAEQRTAKLMRTAMGIAILISCLGLFGLATYSAAQRTKEIGIRKVLGASMQHLLALLSRDFLVLVALAFVIAVPVAWYVMNQWLRNFEYKVDVGWTTFALAGGLALLIALLTVSFQSIRAALANPVDSLRNE
jgi:predicted permease